MKHLIAKLSLAAAALAAPVAMHAQTDRIIGGFTTVAFNQTFLQQLPSLGVTLTDLSGAPLRNGINVLRAVQGVIDLQTTVTDVQFRGGYQALVGGTTIRVEDITLDTTTTSATFTGVLVVNGTVTGRQDILIINRQPAFVLPLQPKNGVLVLPEFSLGLAPAFVAQINQAAGSAVLTPGTQVGTAVATSIVVPDTSRAFEE